MGKRGWERRGQPKKGPAPMLFGARRPEPQRNPGAAQTGPCWWMNVEPGEFYRRQHAHVFAGEALHAYAPFESAEDRHFDRPNLIARESGFSHAPEPVRCCGACQTHSTCPAYAGPSQPACREFKR